MKSRILPSCVFNVFFVFHLSFLAIAFISIVRSTEIISVKMGKLTHNMQLDSNLSGGDDLYVEILFTKEKRAVEVELTYVYDNDNNKYISIEEKQLVFTKNILDNIRTTDELDLHPLSGEILIRLATLPELVVPITVILKVSDGESRSVSYLKVDSRHSEEEPWWQSIANLFRLQDVLRGNEDGYYAIRVYNMENNTIQYLEDQSENILTGPRFSRNSRFVAFVEQENQDHFVVIYDRREKKRLAQMPGNYAFWVGSDHLLYIEKDSLMSINIHDKTKFSVATDIQEIIDVYSCDLKSCQVQFQRTVDGYPTLYEMKLSVLSWSASQFLELHRSIFMRNSDAFNSSERRVIAADRNGNLYCYESSGDSRILIEDEFYNYSPSWSYDEQEIVFISHISSY